MAGKQKQLSDEEQQSNGKQSDDFGDECKQIRVDKLNNMVGYLALMQGPGCLFSLTGYWQRDKGK